LKRLADVGDDHAFVGMELLCGLNPGVVQGHGWPTSKPPTRMGSLESGIRALLNQPPLELRQRTEDVEDEFPAGGRRINGTITERLELHPALVEVFNEVNQVTD
jgi:hypothetical protein